MAPDNTRLCSPRSVAYKTPPRPTPNTPTLPALNGALNSNTANPTLYATGKRCMRIRAGVTRDTPGEKKVLKVVADRAGLSVSETNTALDFYRAVNAIMCVAGRSARGLILDGANPLLTSRVVIDLAGRRPEIVRAAVEKAARGLNPFARRVPAETPPEMIQWDHDLDRLERAAQFLATPDSGPFNPPVARRSGRTVYEDAMAVRAAVRAVDQSLGPLPVITYPPVSADQALPPPDDIAKARSLVEGVARDLPLATEANPPAPVARAALATAAASVLVAAERIIAANGPIADPGTRAVIVEDRPDGPGDTGGTYVVVLRTNGHPGVRIGRLGTFRLPPGYLLYVGSAFGNRGVAKRTGRHRDPAAPLRWNVDHIKAVGHPVELWWTHDPTKVECTWAMTLATFPGFSCPAPRCGENDCKRCPAHLFHVADRPSVQDFAHALGQAVPGHETVYRLRLDGYSAPRRLRHWWCLGNSLTEAHPLAHDEHGIKTQILTRRPAFRTAAVGFARCR